MLSITGTLMSEDKVIATVKKGEIIDYDEALIPFYLKRTKYMEGWLASRAIDTHRTNSRLLKRCDFVLQIMRRRHWLSMLQR